MKKMLLTTALAVVASFAWGQTLRQPLMKTQDVPKPKQQTTTATTTTTTEDMGTITQYSPGSAIVLKETSGPVHYRFDKTVTYVSRSGKVLDEETVKTRIKVGFPRSRPLCRDRPEQGRRSCNPREGLTSNPVSLYRAFLFRLLGNSKEVCCFGSQTVLRGG